MCQVCASVAVLQCSKVDMSVCIVSHDLSADQLHRVRHIAVEFMRVVTTVCVCVCVCVCASVQGQPSLCPMDWVW